MKLKVLSLIIYTITSLTIGTYCAWFFSTREFLSRMLKDLTSMFFLTAGLICAGIFLVNLLRQIENETNQKSKLQSF